MASGNRTEYHGTKMLKRIVELREQNFQPTKSHQKVRGDSSCQLALQLPGINLKLPSITC
eukprot:4012559-Pyramimonas_sp.AAC.1